MKKRTLFTIILLAGLVITGWHFQQDVLAAEQPAATEIGSSEEDSEPAYIEEGDMEPAGDEDVVSEGELEENEPISTDGEVEDSGDEE